MSRKHNLKVVVIGGYAVRAYTKTRPRYTKDIDLATKNEDLPRLRKILEKLKYAVRDRPHGFSGYRKVRGVAITVNAIIEDVKAKERTIKSFYPQVGLSFKAKVASIEELLISKTKLWRERDIIDVCLLILDSYDLIDLEKLKQRLDQRSIKKLLNLIGTRKLHDIWQDFMRRKIGKEEETELWKKLNQLTKSLEP